MKTCPFCAEEIQDAAIVCKHCGRDLATGVSPRSTVVVTAPAAPAWSKGVAAVLSLFIPGAGQIYKGQVLNGLVWLFFTVVGYVALIIPGVILHVCCIFGAYSGDPYADARRQVEHAEKSLARETTQNRRAEQLGRDLAHVVHGDATNVSAATWWWIAVCAVAIGAVIFAVARAGQ